MSELFATKNPNLKKIFFFWRGWSGGEGGELVEGARVSDFYFY